MGLVMLKILTQFGHLKLKIDIGHEKPVIGRKAVGGVKSVMFTTQICSGRGQI